MWWQWFRPHCRNEHRPFEATRTTGPATWLGFRWRQKCRKPNCCKCRESLDWKNTRKSPWYWLQQGFGHLRLLLTKLMKKPAPSKALLTSKVVWRSSRSVYQGCVKNTMHKVYAKSGSPLERGKIPLIFLDRLHRNHFGLLADSVQWDVSRQRTRTRFRNSTRGKVSCKRTELIPCDQTSSWRYQSRVV